MEMSFIDSVSEQLGNIRMLQARFDSNLLDPTTFEFSSDGLTLCYWRLVEVRPLIWEKRH